MFCSRLALSLPQVVYSFKYNGKEFDSKNGLNWYDYGARHYDAALGRFTTVDPLGEVDYGIASYTYCSNNPILYIDPTGTLTSPIYDKEGNLLGTDDEGLQGRAIVMEETDFKQGMSHEEAEKKDLGISALQKEGAYKKFLTSFLSLKDRPDWDGYLTLKEANDWYRNGNGQAVFVDASQINLSPLAIEDLIVDKNVIYNFLYPTTLNVATGLVYGQISLTLLDENGTVRIGNTHGEIDRYDFDMHTGGVSFRNIATKIGGIVAGKGVPYAIRGYGLGKINHRVYR